ncbi:MAG TPA: oligosaccharide flippase family protein [Chitinophagaceae bacterium]
MSSTPFNYLKTVWQSSLFKASGIYTVASFTNAAIPFLLLPVLTRYLSHADFGIVAMFITYTGFLMPFVGVNMEAAIARKYYSDKSEIPVYLGTCILTSLVSFAIVLSTVYVLKGMLSTYTGLPSDWILYGVVLAFFQFMVLVVSTLFQVKVKPFHYGVFQVSQSAINFGLSLVFIIYLGMNWEGRLDAQLSSSVLFGLIAIIILVYKRELRWRFNPRFARHAVKFGAALIPHALGALVLMYTMRFFILHFAGMDKLGLFSVAAQVSSILGFFTLSFNNAFVPWLYRKLNENNELTKKKVVKLTYTYFAAISISGVVFYFLTPLIFRFLINKSFWSAAEYVPLVITGYVFQGMYFMVTNYITYVEKTWYQAIVTMVVGLCNIPTCYFLTKAYGLQGAAGSFAIAFFLLFVFTWAVSSRLYKMPWR